MIRLIEEFYDMPDKCKFVHIYCYLLAYYYSVKEYIEDEDIREQEYWKELAEIANLLYETGDRLGLYPEDL